MQENYILLKNKVAPATLIAVSKRFNTDAIREVYRAGCRDFGENYVQEWWQKTNDLSNLPDITWHIIGHVQSNKTKQVAERATWLHTLDSTKLARRLNEQRPTTLPALKVLIEINISAKERRHGIKAAYSDVVALAREVLALPRLELKGLMCIASNDQTAAAEEFSRMRSLQVALLNVCPDADVLSMGMSGDWPLALQHGATHVRLGQAIFGAR